MVLPKITFGIIVFNGQPFTRYCLRQLYPYAHQIIVVEGASERLRGLATEDGHSTDGTLQELERFVREEDEYKKVTIVKKDGFWSEKDEQSQAYAVLATGDYLWQVDIDEFYTDENMKKIIHLLQGDLSIAALSIMTKTYFGSPQYEVDSYALRDGARVYHRIFRWKVGYTYASHRPPTVLDEHKTNLREKRFLEGKKLYKKYGIFMHHYSLLFPKQVKEKSLYYAQWERADSIKWAAEVYDRLQRPYRVHNIYESISWLKYSHDSHPKQVLLMMKDMQRLKSNELRQTEDVETLLQSKRYNIGIIFLKMAYPFVRIFKQTRARIRRVAIFCWRFFGLGKIKKYFKTPNV